MKPVSRISKLAWLLASQLVFLLSSCTFDTSGPTPPDHNNYSPCQDDDDCASVNCDNDNEYCAPPACDDGRLNGDESATDCGGSCPGCPNGVPCRIPADCAGLLCHEGFCQPDHCVNDQADEGESDLDCGQECEPCEAGSACLAPTDCVSLSCDLGVCLDIYCSDGVRNGNEVDVDCGNDCAPCPDGSACTRDDDCENGLCYDDFCQPATCTNGELDGDETDLDCGGSCAGCELFGACLETTDCRAGLVCFGDACRGSSVVYFDAQGGTTPVPASKEVILGEAYGDLATTDRTGHTFDGWWTGPAGTGTRVTSATIVTSEQDHTLYARWSADTGTVTFDAQGGAALNPGSKVVTFGEPYGELATTNRAGHTLDGWWTGPEGAGTRVIPTTEVTIAGDHTLYAKWLPNTYAVTFDAQGGTAPVPENKVVVFGAAYGALATTSRTGHTFDGWWTGPAGTGLAVTADTLVTNAANHTLYAKWTANVYTVTFNANGGTAPVPATKAVTFGAVYGTLATTSRSGHTFDGWWTGAGGTGTQVTSATVVSSTVNHTLYAKWTANSYTVTFNANGGAAPVPATKAVTFGATYGTLATTTRSGYTFAGWWTGAGGTGSEVTTATVVTNAANHTLYAKWTANSYTVTFDNNGGTAPVPATKSVTFGAAYGTLATTSRPGYTFAGWWTGAGGTGSEVTAATVVTNATNHTLYAKWTANSYTVTFDSQGGTAPIPATKSVTFGAAYGALPIVSLNGYTFGGWWTGAGGTGAQVTSATVVTNAANHTLYAKWTANTYTVTFNAEGGAAPAPATKSVTFDAAYGALATTSRTGYTFAGWWTGAGGTGTQVTAATVVTNASNHTLYAKWTANTYTVTFNAEGGTGPVPPTKTVTFAAAYGALATTTRTGKTFGGWWTGAGGTGSEVTAATVVTNPANHTLYAKWN